MGAIQMLLDLRRRKPRRLKLTPNIKRSLIETATQTRCSEKNYKRKGALMSVRSHVTDRCL